jgi:choline-glycine betaine transporter
MGGDLDRQGVKKMKRMVFALALAALTFVAAYGTSNAAPIAPLPEGVASNSSDIVKAYYWHHHYYHHRHWHHHHWRYW